MYGNVKIGISFTGYELIVERIKCYNSGNTIDRRSKKEAVGYMSYADFFYEIKSKFMEADVSEIKEHLAYQFNIEDEESGGIFYVEVKDGQLSVEPYEYYDRDAMFTSDPITFQKIAEGKIDPVWAVTTQKLKVEGNIDKALRLKEIVEQKQKKAEKV